ncbi:MAG: HU family DNA-binding protein [Paracoccaceae bacterium]
MTQKPMTKTELVAALADATGSDKVTANNTLQAVADIVTKEISAGGAVTLPGLGKFICRNRPDRMVRNPATGEQMHKDADRVAKVTIAKALKDAVNA